MVVNRFRRLDRLSQAEYGLMLVFVILSIGMSMLQIETTVKAVIISTLFGVTTGLWLSHLLSVLNSQINEETEVIN